MQKIIDVWKILFRVAVCFIALTTIAVAADFDGSRPLAGTTGKIIEINRHRIIDKVDPDTVGLPEKFIIDFDAMALRPHKDSVVRKVVKFRKVEHIEDQLVLQGVDEGVAGVDDGLAWSLVISKKNGKAVLSASGNGVAYVVFGNCSPIMDK